MEEINNEMRPFHSIVNFEAILKVIDEAFFLFDQELKLLYYNPAGNSLINDGRGDITGKEFHDLFRQEDIVLYDLVTDAITKQEQSEIIYFYKRTKRWYSVTACPKEDQVVLMFKDIHSQKVAYEELSDREDELREVLDVMPQLGWICDADGEVISMNQKWLEFTGIPIVGGLDTLWAMAVHPDDVEEVKRKWWECVRERTPFEHEYRYRRKDGEYRWFLERTVPKFNERHQSWRWIGTGTEIHEHKVVEEKLKESERRLKRILDTIPQIAWIISPGGELLALNKRWDEVTGVGIEAATSSPAIHPDDLGLMEEKWADALKTGRDCEQLYRIRTIDGEYRWHIARTISLYDDRGELELWVGTATDIHEQKQAEEKLLERERHLRGVLDTIPHIIFITDQKGNPLYYNKQWSEYRGITDNNDSSPAWQLSIYPDDKSGLEEVARISAQNGKGFQHEARLKNISGEYRWHIIWLVPLINDKGELIEWIGTGSDIHDRKLAEQEVRESNNYIQKITETSPALITVYDLNTQRYIYANNEMFRDLNLTGNELLDFSLDQILERVHPEDREKFLFVRDNFTDMTDSDIREFEFRASNASGQWVWLKSRTKAFNRDQKGMVYQLISVTENVTEIKKAEEDLNYTNNFIHQVTEATPDFIAVYDLTIKKYVYVNQAVYEYWMVGKETMLQLTLDDLLNFILPEDRVKWLNHVDEVVKRNDDEIIEITYQTLGPPGEGYIWMKSRTKVFNRDEDGNVIQIMSISQNITAEREAEKALKENQRIQTLMVQKDELFSIASHELKTPITSMKAGLQIVKRQIEQKEEPEIQLVFLTQAIKQVNKLSSLINDLLDITKIQAGKLKLNISSFHIDEIVSEAIMQVSNTHTIELINNFQEPIEADKARIEQVITNYLSNAVKYSPNADTVVVTIDKEDDFVKVSVTDFGIGIPKDHIERVFDRFYRADETSQRFSGLGLGLYISSEIIERHHGKYGVVSEEGKGSTFWFSIPIKYILPFNNH